MVLTGTQVIKKFFESNGGRKVEIAEFKALSAEERAELADLSAKAMGLTKQPNDAGKIEYV